MSNTCLSICSSDSSGGGGVAADIKTFAALNFHGAFALTAVTVQNTCAVLDSLHLPAKIMIGQVDAVLGDMRIAGIKLGAVPPPDICELLSDRLGPLVQQGVPFVLDPVMGTASGSSLGAAAATGIGSAAFDRLLRLANVVTPNLRELRLLAGKEAPQDLRMQAEMLRRRGARAVLVTDADPERSRDWLLDDAGGQYIGDDERVPGSCDHGAGCTHSAALLCFLIRRHSLQEAALLAHRRALSSIRHGHEDVGHGHHPVNVFNSSLAGAIVHE